MRSETMRMAAQIIVRNPGRSALTVLGLSIGVAAFIAMVSFGVGARRSVMSQFQALGTNLIRVNSQASSIEQGPRPPQPLTENDMVALRREATTLAHVVPIARRPLTLNAGARQHRVSVTGTTDGYTVVHDWSLIAGGMIDAMDLRDRAKVCVLGRTPARELFGHPAPLGETVSLGGALTCRVIGVLAEKGYSTSGADIDDVVLIPVTTFRDYVGLPAGYSQIEVQPTDPALLDVAKQEVTDILRRTHRLEPEDADDFRVNSPAEAARAAEQVAGILSGLLAGIAAVSLLVGGIGIMNIQLVSVAERTREIGIRSAIGASPGRILLHFLAESLVLSFVGCAVGVAIGVAASVIVANNMGWARGVIPSAVIGAALFGMVVGLGFGYLPARRAALLDPIAALRTE